jgi:hypothetical protein
MDLASQLRVGLKLQLLFSEVMIRLGLLEVRLPVLADHDKRDLGRSGGKSTLMARARGPRTSSERVMISPRSAGGNRGAARGFVDANALVPGGRFLAATRKGRPQ